MKIAIVTVYSSKNFGSYWQSRTLYDYLTSLGNDVYFLNTKARDIKNGIKKPLTRSIVKSVLKGNIKRADFDFKILKTFTNNLQEVKVVDADTVRKEFDYIVFGSDEIWNASRGDMKAYPVFWGVGFDNIKKVSYAPSINKATKDELLECGFEKALKGFKNISVRDMYSSEVIESVVGEKIEQVLDPTFLFDENYYKQIQYKKIDEPYIAVYMFVIDDTMFNRLKKIANLLGKKLVRVGAYDERFDMCVLAKNPFVYYFDADYVIANTFHGTAFAINFNKQLIVLNNNHVRKTTELLNQFGLGDRDLEQYSAEDIVDYVLNHKIDWEHQKEVVDNWRIKSRNFLKNAIV